MKTIRVGLKSDKSVEDWRECLNTVACISTPEFQLPSVFGTPPFIQEDDDVQHLMKRLSIRMSVEIRVDVQISIRPS